MGSLHFTNPRGGGWTTDNNGGHAVSFTFLEKLIDVTGSSHGVPVEKDAIESLYKNLLYWVDHLDVPDLAPDGYMPPGQTQEGEEGDHLTVMSRANLDADFLKNVLDLLKSPGHKYSSSPQEVSS